MSTDAEGGRGGTVTGKLKVSLGDVNIANVKQLQTLNVSSLPVRYSDKFYRDLLTNGNEKYQKFACWNGFTIGAVCARVEKHEAVEGVEAQQNRLYIMVINVLAAYRRRGVASVLLNYVLEEASKDESITQVYLHVQTSNVEAKDFYLSKGFVQVGIIEGYYKRIEPPDCFILQMDLKKGDDKLLAAAPESCESSNSSSSSSGGHGEEKG